MNRSILFVSICILLSIACKPVFALTAYAIESHDLPMGKDGSPGGAFVKLYERHTRKTVWRRFFSGGCSNVQWSKDHRAVVFETSGDPQTKPEHRYFGFSLVTWQVGARVKLLSHQECEQFDYVEDFYWSPNNKYLMFRTGSSGAADIDEGVLWCLNLKTGKADCISGNVAGPEWITPYWKTPTIFVYSNLIDIDNPQLGHLHHEVSKKPNQYVCR